MEMRTLALRLPLFPDIRNEAVPPMFFSDLGVLPNLISGAESEWWRKRVSRMQRRERRRRTKKMKAERMKNEQGREATCEMRTKHGTDPRAFVPFSYSSQAQHNPLLFLLSNCS